MNKSGKKAGLKYFCEKCDYHARDNHDLKRHCSTRKHKMDNVDNGWITSARDSPNPYHCMLCNKKYKFKSGLCKHNKKYHSSNNIVTKKEIKCPLVKPHVVDIEKESLKEEVKELRNMVHEMVKAQHEKIISINRQLLMEYSELQSGVIIYKKSQNILLMHSPSQIKELSL